jgi:hypothetical protein
MTKFLDLDQVQAGCVSVKSEVPDGAGCVKPVAE